MQFQYTTSPLVHFYGRSKVDFTTYTNERATSTVVADHQRYVTESSSLLFPRAVIGFTFNNLHKKESCDCEQKIYG